MSKRRVGLNFLLLFCFFKELIADDRNNLLDEITRTKTPLVLYVNKHEDTVENSNDLTPKVQPLEPPHDRKAYMLYHILRTTQETEAIDPEASQKLDKTETILREALRSRCNNLNKCMQRCPKKKIYTCTITCQEEYDDYDICNRPKKTCKKSKCAVTKPPYWRMLRNINRNQ